MMPELCLTQQRLFSLFVAGRRQWVLRQWLSIPRKITSLARLPSIPYHAYDCQWVSLDGRIYFLAGEGEDKDGQTICWSNKVFVLDVARQGQWKECASMITPRRRFGCGVMYGKIYVFGGLPVLEAPKASRNWDSSASCPSEVYDPEEDSWSPIRAVRTLRFGHRIDAVMDEFWVFGGRDIRGDYVDCGNESSDDENTLEEDYLTWERNDSRKTIEQEVCHPIKDEWRMKSPTDYYPGFFLFVAQGKLYLMRLDSGPSIDLYDVKKNSWTNVHEYFDIPIPIGFSSVLVQRIRAVVAVDDELAAVRVSWRLKDTCGRLRYWSFESIGFGIKDEQIWWQELQFPIFMASFPTSSSILIQL